ncbi:MAG: hypothetical protein ABSE73_21055, partial [Planctomycetota bacterium]
MPCFPWSANYNQAKLGQKDGMRIYFCVRAWGQAYTDLWLKFGLCSQLSAGNLRYAAARAQCKYLIYTNPEDVPQITGSGSYKALSAIMDTEILLIPGEVRRGGGKFSAAPDPKYAAMAFCDCEFIKKGTRDGAVLVLLAPDLMLSANTFANMCKRLEAGKKAILAGGVLRVLSNTFMPAATALLAGRPVERGLSSRELVSLSLRHLHPVAQSLFWITQDPVDYPFKLCWGVGNSGVLSRSFVLVPLAVVPGTSLQLPTFYSDDDWLVRVCPVPADMDLVMDSDEVFIVEMAAGSFQFGRRAGHPYHEAWIGKWARETFNPQHFYFFRHSARIHTEDLSAEWEAIEAQASRTCGSILACVRGRGAVEVYPAAEAVADNQGLQALEALARSYTSDYEAPRAATTLRAARQRYVQLRLGAPPEILDGPRGKELRALHRLLLLSGLQDEPLDAADESAVQELLSRTAKAQEPEVLFRTLEPCMLYRRAHQLGVSVPARGLFFPWLEGFWQYLLSAPPLFQQEGEAAQFLAHYQHYIPLLREPLYRQPGREFERQAADGFLHHASFVPLYATDAPLHGLASQRAMILECALLGYPVEAPACPRPTYRTKIRLGVLCERFGAHFETCATLPAFERLDRDKFEVLLFALQADGDAGTACCRSRADRLSVLPATLFEQVQVLRDADLDVLLIGSNAAGANDRIALLALHRLARVQWLTAATPIASGMRHCTGRISGTLTEGPGCTAGVPPAGAKLAERENEGGRDARGTLVLLNGPAHCFSFPPDSQLAGTPISREMLRVAPEAALYVSAVPLNMLTFEMRRTWARILAAVPGSALALALTEECRVTPAVVRRFSGLMDSMLRACGVDDQRCVVLSGQLAGLAEKRQFLRLGDVYLDAYPFTSVAAAALALEC